MAIGLIRWSRGLPRLTSSCASARARSPPRLAGNGIANPFRLIRMSSTLNEWRRLRGIAGCTALLAAGCAVGPNFKPPPAPPVAGYTAAPAGTTAATALVAGGQPQRFRVDADIPADWWRLFHSQSLDALIAAALRDNPGLKSAQAALRVAYEDTRAQIGRASWRETV